MSSIGNWLSVREEREVLDDPCLLIRQLVVSDNFDHPRVVAELAQELADQYASTAATLLFSDGDLPDTPAPHPFVRHIAPTSKKVQSGDFGEMLALTLFRVHPGYHDYEMPLDKLQWKAARHPAQPGVDVLGLRSTRDGDKLVCIEVKVSRSRTTKLIVKAHESLQATLDRLAESIVFMVSRAAEMKLESIASRFSQLLDREDREVGTAPRELHAVLITVEGGWKHGYADPVAEALTEDLSGHAVLLPGLGDIIDETFTKVVAGEVTGRVREVAAEEPDESHQPELAKNLADAKDLLRRVRWRRLEHEISDDPQAEQWSATELRNLSFTVNMLRRQLMELPRNERRDRLGAREVAELSETLAHLTAQLERDGGLTAVRYANAAATWHLAGYQANAALLGQELSGLASGRTDEPVARIVELCQVLLQGDPARARSSGEVHGEWATRELDRLEGELASARRADDPQAVVILSCLRAVAEAAKVRATFWTEGAVAGARASRDRMRDAAGLVLSQGVVDLHHLTTATRDVVCNSDASSPWSVLAERVDLSAPIWRRYLRRLALAVPPVVELWPSQIEAIDAGFLDPARPALAVTMPTSAGKSRLAELAIVRWCEDPVGGGLCAYIVPTRALAAEVEQRLSNNLEPLGLSVSALFGGFDDVAYERTMLDQLDVLVATPEKLDLLLRQDPEPDDGQNMASRLQLVIYDEAHEVAEGSRGLRAELLLSRLRRDAPHAVVRALSAVTPNADELGRWLGGDEGRGVTSDWAPTRLHVGVFHHPRLAIGAGGEIAYSTDNCDEPQVLYRVLPLRPNKYRADGSPAANTRVYPRDNSEASAELALHFLRFGPVLVSCAVVSSVGSVARRIDWALERPDHHREGSVLVDPVPRVRAARQRLRERLEEHLLQTDAILGEVLQGVGREHAGLPQEARELLLGAFREATLSVLVATSGVSSGVNFPVGTVVVHSTKRQHGDLSGREFLNLAGRAGRAHSATEGHVILRANDAEDGARLLNQYVMPSVASPVSSVLHDLNRIISQLQNPSDTLLRRLDNWDVIEEMLDQLDPLLLSLAIEETVGTRDEEVLADFLGTTLFAIQEPSAVRAGSSLVRFLARRWAELRQRFPDPVVRHGFYRTGLSVTSCEQLQQLLSEALRHDQGSILVDGDPDRLARVLIEIAAQLREAKRRTGTLDALVIARLADAWMHGASRKELHRQFGEQLGMGLPAVGKLVDNVLSRDLPWTVSGALQVLDLLAPEGYEIPARTAALPALLKFGVNGLGASYARSLSLAQRDICIAIGRQFDADGSGTFADFVTWLSVFDASRLTLPDEQRTRVMEKLTEAIAQSGARFVLRAGTGVIRTELRGLHVAERHELIKSMTLPARVELEPEPDNEADPFAVKVLDGSGAVLGYVAREVSAPVTQVLQEPTTFYVAALVSQLHPDRLTASLVINVTEPADVPF